MANEKNIPVAYVTTYFLSKGIVEIHDAKEVDGYLTKRLEHSSEVDRCRVPRRQWFETIEEAQQEIQRLIEKKLRTIDKQIKKLKSLHGGNVKVRLNFRDGKVKV
jgi:hypothetical protein